MIEGIILAIGAGLMLGLYALPEKYTKDFEFENTWGLFFAINTFVIPNIAAFLLIDGFADVLSSLPSDVLWKMVISSFLWGIGVMMWGKAINHIGLSLGFSIFIGTVILVGSLLPFIVSGLPSQTILVTILAGLVLVLLGIMANGKAGILREKDEAAETESKGGMLTGIIIAVVGGLLATGFNYALAAGAEDISAAVEAQGNPKWLHSVAIMYIIYMAGGLAIAVYFLQQLTAKKLWSKFKTPHFGKNLGLCTIMGVLNFFASALYAYAAFKLGKVGNTVGYAIFNTACVVTAIVSGLLTKEWVTASPKARKFLYLSLACMVIGIIVISIGNGI
jgi:L-rhamnose-H+ transport protein